MACWHLMGKTRGPGVSETEVQVLPLILARCVNLMIFFFFIEPLQASVFPSYKKEIITGTLSKESYDS